MFKGDVFKQHTVGAELVSSVIAMGEGSIIQKRKDQTGA